MKGCDLMNDKQKNKYIKGIAIGLLALLTLLLSVLLTPIPAMQLS